MANPVDERRDTHLVPWDLVEYLCCQARETGGVVSIKVSEADELRRYMEGLQLEAERVTAERDDWHRVADARAAEITRLQALIDGAFV